MNFCLFRKNREPSFIYITAVIFFIQFVINVYGIRCFIAFFFGNNLPFANRYKPLIETMRIGYQRIFLIIVFCIPYCRCTVFIFVRGCNGNTFYTIGEDRFIDVTSRVKGWTSFNFIRLSSTVIIVVIAADSFLCCFCTAFFQMSFII